MTNPIPHKHILTNVSGQRVCMVCNAVVIEPILDSDDARIGRAKPKWLVHLQDSIADINASQDSAANAGQKLMPLDHVLIYLSDVLGVSWPDYIEQLGNRYRGNPPHEAKRWDEMFENYQNTLGEF